MIKLDEGVLFIVARRAHEMARLKPLQSAFTGSQEYSLPLTRCLLRNLVIVAVRPILCMDHCPKLS